MTLSIYDHDRRWLGTMTVPAGAKRSDVLADAIAQAPTDANRPAWYRFGSSGDLCPFPPARPRWERATLPIGGSKRRARYLLYVQADGVAPWNVHHQGAGWFLSGAEPCYVGTDGDLADAVAAQGLPAIELRELGWLRGGE